MRCKRFFPCVIVVGALVLGSAGQVGAHMRLFIRPWWPVPVIVAPIFTPDQFLPPPPQPPPPPPPLPPRPAVTGYFGSVDTDVTPKDAQVIVDGEYRGVANSFDGAPAYLELSPGKHRIEFKREGYKPVSLVVAIEPGEIVSLDLALKESREAAGPSEEQSYQLETATSGFLELNAAPSDAAVYIDGSFYGIASQFREAGHKIMLKAGSHTVEIGKPGYFVYHKSVAIAEKDTLKLDVSLEK